MIVRRAIFADIPALRAAFARLLAELEAAGPGYPVHDATALDTFTLTCAQRLERDPALLCYVATDDQGALLGFLTGEIAQRLIGAPAIFGAAHWLYVYPEARGQGVARALVRAAIPDLHAAGVTHVELAARAGDGQWAARGWMPFLVHHVLAVDGVAAAAAEESQRAEPAAPVPVPAAVAAANGGDPAPARPRSRARPTPRRRRRRRVVRRTVPPIGAAPCS